jgi:hypothetical protein
LWQFPLILFGEVKWNGKPIGADILDELKLKVKEVQWGKKGRRDFFCLFSRKGVTLNVIKG